MQYVQGWLLERTDPGFGRPGGGPGIDNSLPGSQPGIDNTLPIPPPPPGIWPPPSHGRPIVPVNPPGIDNSLPVQPGTIWPPPGGPNYPSHGLPGAPGIDNTLPGGRPPHVGGGPAPGGGRPDNTLPGGGGGRPDNTLPSKTYWMLAYCPSLGWKFISVDPSLEVGHPLPPAAQPK